jgi:putative SOS response-associated peptidase YedK
VCGRFSLSNLTKYEQRFHTVNKDVGAHPNYNSAPTQKLPVILQREDGRHTEIYRWGIPRVLGKDFVKDIINTRSDKAFGGFWKKNVIERRCLVPATSFFEWKKTDGSKQPFLIHPKDLDLFAFAGIWSEWTDKDGNFSLNFSIMTTDPNKEMKDIHDRMPVILHKDEEEEWLKPDLNQDLIAKLLFPSEDGRLEMYPVSTKVNNVRNNSPEILERL